MASRIAKNKETNEPLGYAFVEFETERATDLAIEKTGTVIDQRHITVTYSNTRGASENGGVERPPGCKRVIVSHFFNTDENILRSAFIDCGSIESINILFDKVTKLPRGTAFITFDSEDAATAAVELNGAFIDGRKIRVGYSTSTIDPNACFKCKETGHKSWECPTNRNDTKSNNKPEYSKNSNSNCFNCDKPGHRSFECKEPKKPFDKNRGGFSKRGGKFHGKPK